MEIEMIEQAEQSTALTPPQRAAIALNSDKARTELAELVKKSANVVEIKDKAGRDECHSYAMELVRARTGINKTGKSAREDARKFCDAVIDEEAALIAITEPEEKRLLGLRDAWDAKVAAEKAAKAAAERARVLAINERIVAIKNYTFLSMQCRTSERIQALMDKLRSEWVAFDFEADFAEFGNEAQNTYDTVQAHMQDLHGKKLAEEQEAMRLQVEREAEAKRLEAQRIANEETARRLQAEREAFEREKAALAATLTPKEESHVDATEEPEPVAPAAVELPTPIVVQAEPAKVITLAGSMATPKEVRPGDYELLNVIADYYLVHPQTALAWVRSMDFAALESFLKGVAA